MRWWSGFKMTNAEATSVTDLLIASRTEPRAGDTAVRLAIVGMGLVGRRHLAALSHIDSANICAVVDTDDNILELAEQAGIAGYSDLSEMIINTRPDGIILSTPTNLHVSQGVDCIEAGIPVLIEKPIADDLASARLIVEKSEDFGVPVMVGHHRRFNPVIQQAKAALDSGQVGDIRVVDAKCWFYKPDDYFEIAPWRKKKGAGPISVNLVHDIDLLRYLCGDIINVQAQLSPSMRGYETESIAAALLSFENGGIGVVSVSDSAVSPWSWEFTSSEYPLYPFTAQSAYQISGSHGALSIPDLTLWRHDDKPDWWSPMSSSKLPVEPADPLVNQIKHFAQVILGKEPPLVSGQEGLRTLAVIEAMRIAAKTGQPVNPGDMVVGDSNANTATTNFNIGSEVYFAAKPA